MYVLLVELQLNFSRFGLTVVVPWSLPQDLQDNASEPRHTMKEIIREKVGKISLALKLSLISIFEKLIRFTTIYISDLNVFIVTADHSALTFF